MTESIVAQTPEEIAAAFWKSDRAKDVRKYGLPLDKPDVLPSFLCGGIEPYVEFTSDEDVAEFYKLGGVYDAIKLAVVEAWPK